MEGTSTSGACGREALPDDKVLIPGVIDNTTNFIEHPDVVADRIINYASVVGRENVIAGVDCGFATGISAAVPAVDPKIAWRELPVPVRRRRVGHEAALELAQAHHVGSNKPEPHH